MRDRSAVRAAGLLSAFAFTDGEPAAPDDVVMRPTAPEDPAEAALATVLRDRVQWGVLQTARSEATNTLFSIAHPGLALDRQALVAKGIEPCIPSSRSRKIPYPYDKTLYRQRHKVENLFAKLKDWRRIATRYDRCAHTFFSAICIAATVIFWL